MSGYEIALSVVNTLLTALNSSVLKDTWSSLPYKSKLKKLEKTVTTVKYLLLDAEKKVDSELSNVDLNYIQQLKDIIYDADDFFDEIVTRAQLNQLLKGGNITKKVRYFFKHFKIAGEVNKIRELLDGVADDRAKFGLGIGTQPHRRAREETFSYICAPTVVGRDDDAKNVIGMLLDSTANVKFLTIVGVGGVGKTTLAKLVYNDDAIESAFNLRLWICVSDQDGSPLDRKNILVKILELLNCKFDSSSSIQFLQGMFQSHVKGKRFLLVLDDIWTESTGQLNQLKDLLMIDGSGGRIIVTTRSMKIARIVGDDIHELKGLSDDGSRHLFKMVAFGNGSKPIVFNDVAEKIVKLCSNIPLVIKVVGSLLHGQPIVTWQTFLWSGFAEFSKEENEIMSILKLSYDNLDPSLKSCFAYCAIFPKDYVIDKELLMNLWEAQGYIVPFWEGQSIENAGEEHFSVLLQRCFFQDVKRDQYGVVKSFKIHDFMHDLAQRVSRKEIRIMNSGTSNLECTVRHLLFDGPMKSGDIHFKSKIRSYLMFRSSQQVDRGDELSSIEMPKNWGCLRALGLQSANVRLPDTIGNLLHLRYLNLSYSKMKKLPDSIVRLHNLQTLDISYCKFLVKWPKEFSKLVNLTHLYTDYCLQLSCMPAGLSNLSRLRRLTEFVVEDERASAAQRVGQLTDLRNLAVNLKGGISIRLGKQFKRAEGYDWEGSCLEKAEHLNEVVISVSDHAHLIKEDIVMEKLKPHPNLRKFSLSKRGGEKIARWGSARENWAIVLPKLVHIQLCKCTNLEELPVLSKLQHLKSLSLIELENLVYMEDEATSSTDSSSLDSTFFPSLEYLEIYFLTKLKGWWRSGDSSESHHQPAFPKLSKLGIRSCWKLRSFPHCLTHPKLNLTFNNSYLWITTADGEYTDR